MAEDLTIQVDGSGGISLANPRLKRWLRARAGVWHLEPSVDNLLIFKRPEGQEVAEGRGGKLQFTGAVAAMGGVMDIITFIYTTRRSGGLVVVGEQLKKTLFFTDGRVRMATSNAPEHRLGALLYRFGMVSKEQLEEALNAKKEQGKIGHVLVKMGAITVHDLYTIIRKQIEEVFFSTLLLKDGTFYFYSLLDDRRLSAQINLDTQNLLLAGVQRLDEMSYFRERIPDSSTVLEIRKDITPKDMEEKESKVYGLINGVRSLEMVARDSRLGDFETTKVAFNLMQLGYVRKRAETAPPTLVDKPNSAAKEADVFSALVETFNAVYRKIFAEARGKGTASLLRTGLVSFFEGATGFADLFAGLTLEEDGALPPGILLTNLALVDVDNKVDFLYNGLNELLYFEMFTAGETLDTEDEARLQQDLNAIFADFSGGA